MRYSRDLQRQVVQFAELSSVEDAAIHFNLPPALIQSWRVQDMEDVSLRLHVQQKFYSLIPVVEAQITSAFTDEDLVVCGVSDKEWEALTVKINKIVSRTVIEVYKATLKDPFFHEKRKGEKVAKKEKKTKRLDPWEQPDLFG